MEKKKLPKTVTRVIALMICAAFLSLSGLAILYRVDNKYTAKAKMVQEHVTPVSYTHLLHRGRVDAQIQVGGLTCRVSHGLAI